MSEDEAQSIVYSFADIIAEGAPYVGDASSLPFPKEKIRIAFDKHIAHYEALQKINPKLFRESGDDDTLRHLHAMRIRINDWHDIDQEDRVAIKKLNALQGPPPDWGLLLIVKYSGRTS